MPGYSSLELAKQKKEKRQVNLKSYRLKTGNIGMA